MIFRPVRTVAAPTADEMAAENAAWDLLFADAARRLGARIKEYEPPPLTGLPAQDLVVVYRFPREQEKFFSKEHNWVIPDKYQKDRTPFSLGLLMWAGAEAMDVLVDHGILVGDVVKFAPLAGDEEMAGVVNEAIAEVAKRRGRPRSQAAADAAMAEAEAAAERARNELLEEKKHLRLHASDIHESVDLVGRMCGDKPTMEMVRRREGTRHIHIIRPVVNNVKEMLNADR